MNTRFFVMAALAGGIAPAGPVAAGGRPASYDGTWAVSLVTESGSCDRSYRAKVAIRDGRVQPAGGNDGAAISGGVGGDGRVALDIRQSLARADASGRLKGRSGAGVWRVAMMGCSGKWTAFRQTAEARAN
ncbi:hypothetical protein [Prosthecodimorpha staleyi]|uniref:Uncharacterized protein n=1 Tax=Prosthecodimorpha staleyi TaxID=2840188 RepID=A0A947GJ46_9HYPH|nr:hypothetical protein [Prosthecodimorpha staleyi]MBT9290884.1 hypothetical protein [Prosthecodimorpha staleyi]